MRPDSGNNSKNPSIQEQDLRLFLDSLGIPTHPFDPTLPDDFFIFQLDPAAASFLDARDNKALFIAYRLQGRVFPIGIVFLRGKGDVQFCHSTLLLDSYSQETWMVPLLRKTLEMFFSKAADFLFKTLEPSWENIPLKGQLDCRIAWNARPELKIATDLFLAKSGAVPEIPLFPSVYYYNNPYEENILEAALSDLDGCVDVLSMGTGAGLEAACIALKYGVPVDATDINPIAVANTIAAAGRTGTTDLVRAWVSDGLRQVTKKYDAILFEAPLAIDEEQCRDPNRYDFGGKLLREVLAALPSYLKTGGRMYLMSCPDLSPYVPANGVHWEPVRYFEAKRRQAIHKIRCR